MEFCTGGEPFSITMPIDDPLNTMEPKQIAPFAASACVLDAYGTPFDLPGCGHGTPPIR
jgi:hypothetical protein